MTGFGRYEEMVGDRRIIAELKSVNHKFFEYSLRVSKGYSFLEDKIKNYIASKVSRGKLDIYVHIDNLGQENVDVLVNYSIADGYYKAYSNIKERYSLKDEPSLALMVANQDIFSISKATEDEDLVFADVLVVLEKAINSFMKMRENEGQKLFDDIMGRALKIEERSPQTVNEYRTRIENKMQEVLGDRNIDPQRLLLEAAIFAEKVAISEETVRLKSHISQLRKFLKSSEPIGRKIDFLIQEINREVNTIGSKANDSQIAYLVVDIKAEIEKIREQIQNIE